MVAASKTWTTLEDTDIHLAEQVACLRPTPLPPPLFFGLDRQRVCACLRNRLPCRALRVCRLCLAQQDAASVKRQGRSGGKPRALLCREEASVPAAGWSVDRRTLRRFRQERREEHCVALVCACGAGVRPGGSNSNVGHVSAHDRVNRELCRQLSLTEHARRYGKRAFLKDRLPEQDWQLCRPVCWILCCPEDRMCAACPATQEHLCAECSHCAGHAGAACSSQRQLVRVSFGFLVSREGAVD